MNVENHGKNWSSHLSAVADALPSINFWKTFLSENNDQTYSFALFKLSLTCSRGLWFIIVNKIDRFLPISFFRRHIFDYAKNGVDHQIRKGQNQTVRGNEL